MNLLTLLFRLPFLPLRGTLQLAELIRDQAEREYYNPSAARRQLEESEQARASGQMSEDEVSRIEYNALSRMMQNPGQAPAVAGMSAEEDR